MQSVCVGVPGCFTASAFFMLSSLAGSFPVAAMRAQTAVNSVVTRRLVTFNSSAIWCVTSMMFCFPPITLSGVWFFFSLLQIHTVRWKNNKRGCWFFEEWREKELEQSRAAVPFGLHVVLPDMRGRAREGKGAQV